MTNQERDEAMRERTPAETERLKRELVEDFRTIMTATADHDAAIMVALIKFRQLLDIIYPPAPRNDMADALVFAWQADAGAQEREDGETKMTDFYFHPSQTSPEVMDRWLGVLEAQLTRMIVGGCTCNTKSPTLEFHTERCMYRLASEAMDTVDELKEAAGVPPKSSTNQEHGEG